MTAWQISLVSIYAASLVAVLIGAHYLDSKLGGWRNLAAMYPGLPKQPANGSCLKWQSVWLDNGGVCYLSMVTATIHRDGIQLAMPAWGMRVFYPAIFLPWKDAVSVHRERVWFSDRVKLVFANTPDDPVTISGALADQILSTVGPVWKTAPTSDPASLAS
jgi:hypothetical protein